jgi:hypothetical protein
LPHAAPSLGFQQKTATVPFGKQQETFDVSWKLKADGQAQTRWRIYDFRSEILFWWCNTPTCLMILKKFLFERTLQDFFFLLYLVMIITLR